MTRATFLAAYRSEVVERYGNGWAADAARLERFMAAVEQTISTDKAPWAFSGAATTAAWRAIGGKGKPTLKALRGLA